MQIEVDLEKTPCVFAHSKIENLFYCENHPQGMTQNILEATKFVGKDQRMAGMNKLKEKYPQIKDGMIIFHYFD